MAISYVDIATLTEDSATAASYTVNVPALVQNGDLLLAIINSTATTTTFTRPGGWTTLAGPAFATSSVASTGNTTDVSWRIASSEPASYTWTISGVGQAVAAIIAYRGVDNTNPIDSNRNNTFTGTNQTWDTLTTVADNAMIVAWITSDNANADGPGSYSNPAGYTQRASFQQSVDFTTLFIAEKLKSPAGAESGVSSTYTTTNAATGTFYGMVGLTPAIGAPIAWTVA